MGTIIPISDFLDPALDAYARLSENQLVNRADPENGMFIAETGIVIRRAMDAGYEPISFLMEQKAADTIGREFLEEWPEIPCYVSSLDVLTNLIGYPLTRGLLALMRRKSLPSVYSVCNDASRVAVLENVMNPTNVGAIIRSAAALNVDAVLLTAGSSDPLYRRAIRVSMGTVFQIPWTVLPKDRPYTEILHEMGYKTVAMALRDDSYAIYDPILSDEPKLAIVLGTEGEGLADKTIEESDYTVKIPMSHGVDSLNVAAASAVAFYQLATCNQRKVEK